MPKNTGLREAKRNKKDEFYTQLSDIENELIHYREHFRGKTVFCNCDDPFESKFFEFFVTNFNLLQLKKVIATSYEGSPIMGRQLMLEAIAAGSLFDVTGKEENRKTPYKAIVAKVYDTTGDGGVDMLDVANLFKSGENELSELKGSGDFLAGDFRSDECKRLLEEADIVSTNPPFSLFREYVAQLVEFGKKFVIIGSLNAITYKEIFPLIKDNKLWLGPSIHSGDRKFYVPDDYPLDAAGCGIDEEGKRFIRVKGVRWFTNLDHKRRHEPQILYRKYRGNEEAYPKYDNYDAIEVSKTGDIPCDYDGVMGVPVSFLDKYNPEQFEILGTDFEVAKPVELGNGKRGTGRFYLAEDSSQQGAGKNLRRLFSRIIIRRKASR